MEIRTFSNFLKAALIANVLLMLVTVFAVRASLVRISHYQPPMPISTDQIYQRIEFATTNFLSHHTADLPQSHANMTSMLKFPFSISEVRRPFLISCGALYYEGDFIDVDGSLFEIVRLSYERQRAYLRNLQTQAIAVAIPAESPARSEDEPAGRDGEHVLRLRNAI